MVVIRRFSLTTIPTSMTRSSMPIRLPAGRFDPIEFEVSELASPKWISASVALTRTAWVLRGRCEKTQ